VDVPKKKWLYFGSDVDSFVNSVSLTGILYH